MLLLCVLWIWRDCDYPQLIFLLFFVFKFTCNKFNFIWFLLICLVFIFILCICRHWNHSLLFSYGHQGSVIYKNIWLVVMTHYVLSLWVAEEKIHDSDKDIFLNMFKVSYTFCCCLVLSLIWLLWTVFGVNFGSFFKTHKESNKKYLIYDGDTL